MGKPVGGADDHDLLADPHRVGVACLRHAHGRRHPLELEQRHIGRRIGRDYLRAHDLTGHTLDGDLVHAVDDVSGRHRPAVTGDQDAGARFVEPGDASGADVAPLRPHHDDGRVDLAEEIVEVLGLGGRGDGRQHAGREDRREELPPARHYVDR